MYKFYLGGAIIGVALLLSYFVYKDSASVGEVAGERKNIPSSDTNLADRLLAKLDASSERTNQSIDSLAQELDSLSGRISNLESSSGIERKETEYAPARAYVEQDPELLEQQRLDKLNEKFLAEPLDELWSEEAKIGVDNIFLNPDNSLYQEVQLLSSACRGATCKLEVAINDGVDSDVVDRTLLSDAYKLGFNSTKSHVKVVNGVITTTYFTSVVEPPSQDADPRQRLVR